MKAPKARLALVVHLLTVLILALKGFDKITQAHLLSGITLILLALCILVLLIAEKRLHVPHTIIKQACLFIEAVALFIVAYVYYQEGRQYVQYVFAASALAYLVVALVHYKRHQNSSH